MSTPQETENWQSLRYLNTETLNQIITQPVSYAALTDAKNTIDTLAAQDKAAETGEGERVNPEKFIEARTAFSAAVDGLVDVTG